MKISSSRGFLFSYVDVRNFTGVFIKKSNTLISLLYRAELFRINQQINHANSQYGDLHASKANALARFGRDTPRLVQLIEEAVARGQFHRRPRGPIGKHVSMKDDHWTVAVETCLGPQLLCAYICHDFQDNQLLETLMHRANMGHAKPSIYIRK